MGLSLPPVHRRWEVNQRSLLVALPQLLPQLWARASPEKKRCSSLGKSRTLSHWPSLCPLTLLSPLSLWTMPGMCPLTKHSSGVRRGKASPGQGSPGKSPVQSLRSWRLGIKQAINLVRNWNPQQRARSLPGWLMPSQAVGSLYADVLVEIPTV